MKDDYLNPDQVAKLLRCSRRKVLRIKAEIGYEKHGRTPIFRPEDVEAYRDRQRVRIDLVIS